MFYRNNIDFEEYPHDHDITHREIRYETDQPERLKKFTTKPQDSIIDIGAEDVLFSEDEDGFADLYGEDMAPSADQNLPVVDHRFDEEAFNDLPHN